MAVKIRMQRHGSKKRPFYFIVAANSTSPRDGKFIEKLGTYNPLTVPATVEINRERALDWLLKGAQPTNTVRKILSFKGVLYMKHLQRGVKLGLFDDNAAQEKFAAWLEEHDKVVMDRKKANQQAKKDKMSLVAQESAKKVEERQAARKAEQAANEAAAAAEAETSAETESAASEESAGEEQADA